MEERVSVQWMARLLPVSSDTPILANSSSTAQSPILSILSTITHTCVAGGRYVRGNTHLQELQHSKDLGELVVLGDAVTVD